MEEVRGGGERAVVIYAREHHLRDIQSKDET
jgi:hypothetical protein